MSNYVQITTFTPKDSLLTGNPAKKILGATFDPEFAAIAVAIATKYDATTIGSAPVGFADGAANLPGITFASDTAMGLYKAGADILGISTNGVSRGTINAAGAWSIPAPTAGTALSLAGFANSTTATISGSSTSGQSFGALINAGTTSADYALNVKNQGNTQTYLQVLGNGESYIFPPAAATGVSNCFQIGYMETPLNTQAGGYTLVMGDRGKLIQQTAVAGFIIPANASVAFPIGTTIMLYNNSGSSVAINITTDTLTFLPSNSTGARSLAANSIATIYKLAATSWRIWGFGIT